MSRVNAWVLKSGETFFASLRFRARSFSGVFASPIARSSYSFGVDVALGPIADFEQTHCCDIEEVIYSRLFAIVDDTRGLGGGNVQPGRNLHGLGQ